MVEQDKVGKVEIQEQDNRILFTDKDETVIYKTAMVSDDDLSARLLEAGVSFKGEEIEQTSLLVDILGWVLPILIFIALGQYMSKKMADKLGGGVVEYQRLFRGFDFFHKRPSNIEWDGCAEGRARLVTAVERIRKS